MSLNAYNVYISADSPLRSVRILGFPLKSDGENLLK